MKLELNPPYTTLSDEADRPVQYHSKADPCIRKMGRTSGLIGLLYITISFGVSSKRVRQCVSYLSATFPFCLLDVMPLKIHHSKVSRASS
ncbi:unnamed protein product [Protopolystoma xenopodis]|uniref:Uncharacterized protein n=1 Tax=Protopolystoma xenopodis TaxID=117903 RepID=A0A448XCL7_9PLAT|nr:unnamed protein product [Protopolystoma xenopodis]